MVVELLGVLLGQAAIAKPIGTHQGAVHEQVGVAADRRGEMGVAGQRQTEMAERFGSVARLHLGAQHLLHDLRPGVIVGADPLDDPIEDRGPDDLAEGEFDVEGGEIILERDQLFAARRFVDAVHDRRLLALQRFGRRDIGGDHKVFDQSVRIEPFARGDRQDAALLVEHHPALGQVEFQRFALVPRGQQRAPTGPQGLQRLVDQLGRHRPFQRWHRAGRGSHFKTSSLAASIAACAFSYAMFAATQILARENRQLFSAPSLPTWRWQASAARSWPSFSEQMSDDSSCGNIGTTRSGK